MKFKLNERDTQIFKNLATYVHYVAMYVATYVYSHNKKHAHTYLIKSCQKVIIYVNWACSACMYLLEICTTNLYSWNKTYEV